MPLTAFGARRNLQTIFPLCCWPYRTVSYRIVPSRTVPYRTTSWPTFPFSNPLTFYNDPACRFTFTILVICCPSVLEVVYWCQMYCHSIIFRRSIRKTNSIISHFFLVTPLLHFDFFNQYCGVISPSYVILTLYFRWRPLLHFDLFNQSAVSTPFHPFHIFTLTVVFGRLAMVL